nr:ABC-type transport systems permease component [uncultured bacterium]
MDNLVLANLWHRKTRTALSIAGIALGSILIVLTVGIINGFLRGQARRNSAVTAEIMMRRDGAEFGVGFEATTVPSVPLSRIQEMRSIEGIKDAVPVSQYFQELQLIDGVDYDAFTRVSDMRVVEGKPALQGDEIMIDRILQKNRQLRLGDEIKVFDRPFRIVGIYEPESLGRFKIPLATLQKETNRPNLCSLILIKVADATKQDEVAQRIKQRYPESSLTMTRDLPILFTRGTPSLQVFKKVVVGLAAAISFLIILLAMYTTVTERTKLIGILKSLGASKLWIAGEFEKEAFLISLMGVLAGFAASFGGKYLIEIATPLRVELDGIWFFYSLIFGVLSGLLGALYPALRAANQDPVKAFSYE